jgi:hypothetical protein
MQHAPTELERKYISTMSDAQRLEYFLTRTMESEEVWGLVDNEGWLLQENNGRTILPIWPYRQFVEDCIDSDSVRAGSVSLEHFVDNILHSLVAGDIDLEIWPAPEHKGEVVSAEVLLEMFTSLFESSEYRLEG